MGDVGRARSEAQRALVVHAIAACAKGGGDLKSVTERLAMHFNEEAPAAKRTLGREDSCGSVDLDFLFDEPAAVPAPMDTTFFDQALRDELQAVLRVLNYAKCTKDDVAKAIEIISTGGEVVQVGCEFDVLLCRAGRAVGFLFGRVSVGVVRPAVGDWRHRR